ncbi:pep-cterm sorting domain-containing protein [Anaeramoeba flamelloides]|uniref:Pep-cterm sorting domain-containing protein n=1 Tax=Anaeramoeba flamelloides TaxID=1746091 RepID=A0AAV7Y892_9EUKA|nr:pep-cterm sorting domain-containing protein [Anaeramoeba flamelloides]
MTTKLPIQRIENSVQKEEVIWSDVCLEDNKKVEAIVYCQDCGENQCEECDIIHKSRKFSEHVRTDPKQNSDNNRTENCPIHKNNKLSRYCKNCQKLICSECSFEHSNHETISFDQPMDFYKELINEQKNCTQNHFNRINEKFEEINISEKGMKSEKEKFLREISNFYLNQKKLLEFLEQNEIKLTNDFFEQISITMKREKQIFNNSKSSTENLLEQFLELETNLNQSNSFGFFRLFSKMQLTKTQEKPNSQFPRLCNEHKNKTFEFFCLDHKKLLCSYCLALNHSKCNQVVNLKKGKMSEEISIQQKEKYFKLNNQSNEIQKEIEKLEVAKMIIKEIEICKKYNDYQQILINFSKLKKLMPVLKQNDYDKLIYNSKFDKINFIRNYLKDNSKNWKSIFPYDLNKTQINLQDEILLENKFQFSILLKNEFNESVNAQEFNLKVEILKSNSNEMITEITNFQEGKNQESIGEYLFQEEGEYQINFSINDQKIPKSPFQLTVIDLKHFLKESEILQKENNPKFNQILEKWIKEAGCNSNLQKRFNSRTDGWKIATFHEKCDKKGKSIILVKLNNKSLFGGFTAIDWNSTDEDKQSIGNKSFLFSLIRLDPNFTEPLKMHVFQKKEEEIYCHPNCGPYFGRDLELGHSFKKKYMNEDAYSNLGYTYKAPFGYEYDSKQAKNFLAGSYENWKISQIEIFCEN